MELWSDYNLFFTGKELLSQANRTKLYQLYVPSTLALQIPDTRLIILVSKEEGAGLPDSGHVTNLTERLMKNLTKLEQVSI